MKYTAALLSFLLLGGCYRNLTPAEIRAAIDECKKAGLEYRIADNPLGIPEIIEVYCWPAAEKKP